MKHTELQRGIVARTRNGDRNQCPGSPLAEKWIDRFQEKRFLAAHQLRKLRLHAQLAGEIQVLAAQLVSPIQLDHRARYAKSQSIELDHSILQIKFPSQIRNRASRIRIIRFPQRMAAE